MQNLQFEQVRYANGFLPACITFSHGLRSKCEVLFEQQSLSLLYMPSLHLFSNHGIIVSQPQKEDNL